MVIHPGPVTEAGSRRRPGHLRVNAAPDRRRRSGTGPPSDKQLADDALFFLRMLKPFLAYVPDVEALRSGPFGW